MCHSAGESAVCAKRDFCKSGYSTAAVQRDGGGGGIEVWNDCGDFCGAESERDVGIGAGPA